nr:E3 ubiquitin-protein ligase RNF139-like [Onthophagus taurus]
MSETVSTSTMDLGLTTRTGHKLKDIFVSIGGCLKRFLIGFVAEMSAMEYLFIKMYHIYSFICQFFFLALCEVAVIRSKHSETERKEERMISGLTTLLFYSVFGYFVSRVREIYVNEIQRRGPTPRHSHHSSYRQYAYWICKIVIEWAKTIVIVICLREQGLNYQPNAFYNVVTFIYYICTEKITSESIEALVTLCGFTTFDSMEYLFVPIILKSTTALLSFILIGSLLNTPYGKYALLSSYFLLYLNLKDLCRNYIYPLIIEKRTYASFRMASNNDLETWDDICAVCLNKMSKARITPCNHLFHPLCLKRCLKNSLQCPLCKQNFLQTI